MVCFYWEHLHHLYTSLYILCFWRAPRAPLCWRPACPEVGAAGTECGDAGPRAVACLRPCLARPNLPQLAPRAGHKQRMEFNQCILSSRGLNHVQRCRWTSLQWHLKHVSNSIVYLYDKNKIKCKVFDITWESLDYANRLCQYRCFEKRRVTLL